MATDTQASLREVWDWLSHVPDPEIPVISLTDLGIIREIAACTMIPSSSPSRLPTRAARPRRPSISISRRRFAPKASRSSELKRQISPAWTTDWMSAEGREKLRAYGIAPPIYGSASDGRTRARVNRMMGVDFTVPCPRCSSTYTTKVSQFGSTSLQGQLPLL